MVNLENHRKNYKGVKAYLIARVSDESQRQVLPAQELRLKNYNTALSLDGTLYKFDETAYDEKKRKQFSDIVYNKICKEKNISVGENVLENYDSNMYTSKYLHSLLIKIF